MSRKNRMYVINLKQTMSLDHPSFATSSLNQNRVRARAAPNATGLTRDGDNQELPQRFSSGSGRDLSGRELSENSGFHSHRQSFGTASPSRDDSRNFPSGSRARSIDMRLELHNLRGSSRWETDASRSSLNYSPSTMAYVRPSEPLGIANREGSAAAARPRSSLNSDRSQNSA